MFGWDAKRGTIDAKQMTWERFKEIFYQKYFSITHWSTKIVEFINIKQEGQLMIDYIRKFDESSRFAPHMVSTNALSVDQFL